MSKLSKIASLVGIGLIGTYIYGRKKLNVANEVINNLKVGIKSIHNVQMKLPKSIEFDAILTFTNNTNIEFGATTTSYIAIREILIYSSENKFLGSSKVNFYQVYLPAGGTVELPNMKIELLADTIFQDLLSNISGLNKYLKTLKYEVKVNAFGHELIIK